MKIAVFPIDTNPYQELLYQEMRKHGDKIVYIAPKSSSAALNLLLVFPILLLFRLQGYNILHLHWTYPFALKADIFQTRFFKRLLFIYYTFLLFIAKRIGFRIVWTAHNLLPHEPVFLDDVRARRVLLRYADLIIAHSATTLDKLKIFNVTLPERVVIPSGSYVGVYPMKTNTQKARRQLGIPSQDFVYLYLGQVRPYKGLEELITAFKKISQPATTLVIAGKFQEKNLKEKIEMSLLENIHVFDEYVPREDLQLYFAAADIVVLPFKKVDSSGSALLALSFGKGVIVPELGELTDLSVEVAYKYAPEEVDGLEKGLLWALENRKQVQGMGVAAGQYARSITWGETAKITRRALLALGRRP